MWLITDCGFFSIVEKPEDRQGKLLTVRGRVREDLEKLSHKIAFTSDCEPPEIIVTPNADYGYRIRVPRQFVINALSRIIDEINYDNFKNSQPDERHPAYYKVWSALSSLRVLDK